MVLYLEWHPSVARRLVHVGSDRYNLFVGAFYYLCLVLFRAVSRARYFVLLLWGLLLVLVCRTVRYLTGGVILVVVVVVVSLESVSIFE